MHILHIPAWYKTPENPHLGNFFREQIFAIKDAGNHCGVIYPQYTFSFKNAFSSRSYSEDEAYDDMGVWTVRQKINPSLPFDRFTNFNIARFKKKMLEIFDEYVGKQGRPDIIHAHGIFMGAIAANCISDKYKIPFVNTEQFTGLIIGNQTDNKVLKGEFLSAFTKASKIILCTEAFRNSLIEKYGFSQNIFTIIPNMVNPLFLDPKPLPPRDVFKFINIAYLKDKKNHKLLIDSFAIVEKDYPQISLDIIGNGELRSDLELLVKSYGLEDKITFLGLLNREEVKESLDHSHASILTSKIETFGVCVIESLAAGRPTIATKCGGPEEIIKETDGLIVENHTVPEVVEAMNRLIENYDQYNTQKISDNCRDRYTPVGIARKLIHLYTDVIKTG